MLESSHFFALKIDEIEVINFLSDDTKWTSICMFSDDICNVYCQFNLCPPKGLSQQLRKSINGFPAWVLVSSEMFILIHTRDLHKVVLPAVACDGLAVGRAGSLEAAIQQICQVVSIKVYVKKGNLKKKKGKWMK